MKAGLGRGVASETRPANSKKGWRWGPRKKCTRCQALTHGEVQTDEQKEGETSRVGCKDLVHCHAGGAVKQLCPSQTLAHPTDIKKSDLPSGHMGSSSQQSKWEKAGLTPPGHFDYRRQK